MQITQNKIETLEKKCPVCKGQGGWYYGNEETGEGGGESCQDCEGSGKATIEIKKEWVENKIKFKTINEQDRAGVEKITKYKVGDEINAYPRGKVNPLKLKIISETENKWKVCLI